MGVTQHRPHKVFVAQHWADDWEEKPGLFCDFCTFSAAPTVSEAQLAYKFGYMQRAGSEQLIFEGPLSIDEYYVKVEISQGIDDDGDDLPAKKWIGVVVNSSKGRHGMAADAAQPGGRQTFICRGLEFFLQRTIIDKSWVMGSSGDEKEIQRAVGFNLGSGDETAKWREANRALEFGVEGVGIFDVRSGEDIIPWTSAEAINYLLKYYPPQDKNGDAQIEFSLDPGFSSTVLQALEPALQVHGKNLKQILDELVDRRRLVTWKIDFDDDENPVIKAFTFNASDVELPEDQTITANADQRTVYFDSDGSIVGVPKLTTDSATRYDLIIARGERLGACFTISYQTGTLDKDWTSDLQTKYQDAATGAAGYAALSTQKKIDWNASYRRSDELIKVYRYYRLSLNWDGYVSDHVVCPDPSTPFEPDNAPSAAFWVPGLRFKPVLPLLTENDYSTSTTSPTVGTLADSKAEYRRPFAVGYDGTSRYYFLDKIGAGGGPTRATADKVGPFAVSVRMHDDHCAVILDVNGAGQHAIAKNDFTAAEGTRADAGHGEEATFSPVFNWKQIHVTVFVEFDQYAEQKYPDTQLTTDADQVRRLIIDVPKMRLDYLAPSTIVGLDNAGLVIEATGGYVRDDRDRLKDIARAAYAWYGQERQTVEFVKKNLVSDLDIGTLITKVGSSADPQTVNTVVTQMSYDLLAGTVAVKTQFGELDLAFRYV